MRQTIRAAYNAPTIDGATHSAAKNMQIPPIIKALRSFGNQTVIIGTVGSSLGAIALMSETALAKEKEKQNIEAKDEAKKLYKRLLVLEDEKYKEEKRRLINSASDEVLKKCVEEIAKNINAFINDQNALLLIMERYKEAAKEFTQPAAKSFNQTSPKVLMAIIKHNKEAAKIFTQPAVKNFDRVHPWVIRDIIKNNKEAAKIFTPIAIKNFHKIDSLVLEAIIENNEEALKIFTQLTLDSNKKVNESILKIIIKHNREVAKMFQEKLSLNILEDTQTGGHAKNKKVEILSYLLSKKKFIPFINQVIHHEKELNDEGKFVLYHGMSNDIDFLSQVYTKLWKTTHKEKLDDDFRFLRFSDSNGKVLDHLTKESGQEPQSELELRKKILKEVAQKERDEVACWRMRLLFANAYLFGNLDIHGSCTIKYVIENFSINDPKISFRELFNCFNISEKTYNKYKDRLENLRELNKKIGAGRLLQIGLTEEQLHACVYTANSGGPARDIKIQGLGEVDSNKNGALILEVLKKVPEAIEEKEDWIYCIVLTSDIMLNKNSGVKMRFYHTGDENEWQSYTKQRDELFEEIARDVEMEKKNSDASLTTIDKKSCDTLFAKIASHFKDSIKILGAQK
ncbi:MAG TPA: hypothetical protein VJ201_07835, partial [Candidatus Babeliales bacterium]|nr:hypothetical protein [Candidatus Babeliales bacterium]